MSYVFVIKTFLKTIQTHEGKKIKSNGIKAKNYFYPSEDDIGGGNKTQTRTKITSQSRLWIAGILALIRKRKHEVFFLILWFFVCFLILQINSSSPSFPLSGSPHLPWPASISSEKVWPPTGSQWSLFHRCIEAWPGLSCLCLGWARCLCIGNGFQTASSSTRDRSENASFKMSTTRRHHWEPTRWPTVKGSLVERASVVLRQEHGKSAGTNSHGKKCTGASPSLSSYRHHHH